MECGRTCWGEEERGGDGVRRRIVRAWGQRAPTVDPGVDRGLLGGDFARAMVGKPHTGLVPD